MATTVLRDRPQLCILKRCKTIRAEDRISDMPDEILIHILSLLTLKEAITTGILSKRWKNLWTSHPNLDFGCLKLLQFRRRKYMRCVENIIRKYSGQKLHRFRIVRPAVESGVLYNFDDWISFALKNGVSELELNLDCIVPGDPKNYYFPAHVFGNASIKQFESLRELCLRSVNLMDDVFDLILSSCLSLERFTLHSCLGLVNAKNTAPHLKLKSLELYTCKDLEYLQVLAPNLISFRYEGGQITLCIKDAKQLASLRLSTGHSYLETVTLPGAQNFVFNQFSSHFPNLKSLVVSAHLFEDMIDFTALNVFSSLKQLAVDVKIGCSTYLGYKVVASIIRGAPLLELLEIVLPAFIDKWVKYPALELASMSVPHQTLKEVKLFGFRGDPKTMDFLSYLSENTVSLQKIDITPLSAWRIAENLEVQRPLWWKADEAEHAKNCVLHLRQILHADTQLLFHES